MKLRRLMRATVIGAAMEYFFDPVEGPQRRAAMRARLSSLQERAALMLESLRPQMEQAATVAKERAKTVGRDLRGIRDGLATDADGGADQWTRPDPSRENAATEKGELEARI